MIGAALLAVAAVAALFFLSRGEGGERTGSEAPAPTPTDQHAAWKVTVVAQPIKGKPTRGETRAARDQEDALAAAVSRVHDALILGAEDVAELEGGSATADATKAMAESPLASGTDPDAIEASRRATRISVEADRARRAVARTTIKATVTQSDGDTDVTYETTMWLERAGRRWRVIAFEGGGKPS